MNENENKNSDGIQIDPDYETTYTAIRNAELKEEKVNKLTEEKLRTIIEEEFDKQLKSRQKQLEEIEDKIFRAQKLLHVVRYVLISSYYNNKALEYESSGPSALEATNILTGQNRIHPAVKKLLGSNVNNLKFLTSRTKRKAAVKLEPDTFIAPEIKKIKLEESNKNDALLTDCIKLEPNKNPKVEQEVQTNRKKTQHRLVIGNISYFKKSLEQDNLTHKWMVYVKVFRGSKDGPEVSNLLINRVIFYLHPSYKPHDVVEISHPPYHLSRRGWGEFPLRVQIYFKSPLNKPVDVIHHLKLDKTFSERQTLGNETSVPIFLYDESLDSIIKLESDKKMDVNLHFETVNNNYTSMSSLSTLSNSISSDQLIDSGDIKIEPSTSYEHNYCFENDNIKQEILDIIEETVIEEYVITSPIREQHNVTENVNISNICLRDHSYSLPYSKEGQKTLSKRHKSPVKQAYNELIYGLGPNYLDPHRSKTRSMKPKVLEKVTSLDDKNSKNIFKVLKTVTGQSIRFLPESFSQVLLSNGNVVSVKFLKSPPNSIQKPTNSKRILNFENKLMSINSKSEMKPSDGAKWLKDLIRQEKFLLKLPENKFKNMGEALPYLFKRIPLWTPRANDIEYKCTYPFTACSKKEYESCNVGKRLAAEWSRAKTIRRILSEESYSQNWNTKAIFMYARSHLYSPPVSSYRLFKNESLEKHLILNSFANSRLQNGCTKLPLEENEEAVNILSPSPVKEHLNSHSTGTYIDISDRRLTQECAFVKEAAFDVGIILKPEELSNGFLMNASERLILEAVKCFAENLVRRSRNFIICKSGSNYNDNTSVITTNEIKRALAERKEFESIKKFQESKITMDFFS